MTVARQRSLFNDPAAEINELTFVIKEDLGILHTKLEDLHGWVAEQQRAGRSGSAKNSDGLPLSQQGARHSSAIVDNLKQDLMRTTKSFQEVLQVRTQTLKEQHQRRKQFEAGGGASAGSSGSSSSNNRSHGGDAENHSSSSSSTHPNHQHSGLTPAVGNAAVRKRGGANNNNPFDQLMSQAAASASASASANKQQQQQQPGASSSSNSSGIDLESSSHDDAELSFITPGASGAGGLAGLQQAQQQAAQAQDQSDEYLSSRARAVEDIESTISQLGGMYSRLVHLIQEQEEVTLTIDSNMDSALEHMESGHSELLKFYDTIKGGKWLIIKIFAILIAFLVFFMIFVA